MPPSIEFWLLAAVGVALVSTLAWLISLALAKHASLQHAVLYAGLLCCLALPAANWLCSAIGFKLVSIPVAIERETTIAHHAPTPPPAGTPAPIDSSSVDPSPISELPPATLSNQPEAQVPSVQSPLPDAPRTSPREINPTVQPTSSAPSWQAIANGLFLFWSAVAILLLIRLAMSYIQVARLRSEASELRDSELQSLLQEISAKLKLRRTPKLLSSPRAITPMAIGFLHPAILLPEVLLPRIDREALRDIFTHEAAHLARGDQFAVLLQAFAAAIFWPIISIHLLNRSLKSAREALCDNMVLQSRPAADYGRTLLQIAQWIVNPEVVKPSVAIFERRSELQQRVTSLLDARRNLRTHASMLPRFVIAMNAVAMLILLSTSGLAARPLSPGTPGERARVRGQQASAEDKPIAQETKTPQQTPEKIDPNDPKYAGLFTGTVKGPDGKPFAGARIYLLPTKSEQEDPGPLRATTDAEGKFAFNAPDMTYLELDGLPTRREALIIAAADGFAPDWFTTWGETRSTFHSHWDPVKGAAIDLQLSANDVPFEGQLVDEEGRPIKNVSVKVANLMIPSKRDLDAYIDRLTKNPMASANPGHLRQTSRVNLLPSVPTTTKTDDEGRFKLVGLGRDWLAGLSLSGTDIVDEYLLVMIRPGAGFGGANRDGKSKPMYQGSGQVFPLRKGLTVRGVVRDRETKEPIAGIWVGMQHEHPQRSVYSGKFKRITGADGRFTISGLDPQILAPLKPEMDKSHAWAFEMRKRITAVASPGVLYRYGSAQIVEGEEMVIECDRATPFRLKIIDEAKQLVEADVTYLPVAPNTAYMHGRPMDDPVANRAAKRPDGAYEGYFLPGPGAVFVKPLAGQRYRPAHVDPKSFFAPGKTDWTLQERISTYGTHRNISTYAGYHDQTNYSAIVLINPSEDSGPLELSATVLKDRPRMVHLVDAEGKPVTGVRTTIEPTSSPHAGMLLRSTSFPIYHLHPNRTSHLFFYQHERKLIGYLAAKGDSEEPYTVVMQPWATLTGRTLTIDGGPSRINLHFYDVGSQLPGEPIVHTYDMANHQTGGVNIDETGRFTIDKLVPGRTYGAVQEYGISLLLGPVAQNIVLQPGETRDLGDMRFNQPIRPANSPPK